MIKCQVCGSGMEKYGKYAVICHKCSIVWRGFSSSSPSFSLKECHQPTNGELPSIDKTECFKCNLLKACVDCSYTINDGYAQNRDIGVKRANEAWSYFYPDDLMPQKGFVIHHDNGNKLDDSKANIKKWDDFGHRRYHSSNPSDKIRAIRSNTMKGNQHSKGFKFSTEQKSQQSKRMRLYWADVKSGKIRRPGITIKAA